MALGASLAVLLPLGLGLIGLAVLAALRHAAAARQPRRLAALLHSSSSSSSSSSSTSALLSSPPHSSPSSPSPSSSSPSSPHAQLLLAAAAAPRAIAAPRAWSLALLAVWEAFQLTAAALARFRKGSPLGERLLLGAALHGGVDKSETDVGG